MTKKETAKAEPQVEKKEVVLKDGNLDIKQRVSVTATEKRPYEKEGKKFKCSPFVAEKAKLKGWAK